jgi:hypothetical protein
MTIVTMKLKLDSIIGTSKARVLVKIGEIANALIELDDVEVLDVFDDLVPVVAMPPVEAPPRRKRGPNKAKPAPGAAATSGTATEKPPLLAAMEGGWSASLEGGNG